MYNTQRPQLEQSDNPADEPAEVCEFRISVFYRLIDGVVLGLTTRFEAAKCIDSLFGFLYKFLSLSDEDLTLLSQVFVPCTKVMYLRILWKR